MKFDGYRVALIDGRGKVVAVGAEGVELTRGGNLVDELNGPLRVVLPLRAVLLPPEHSAVCGDAVGVG